MSVPLKICVWTSSFCADTQSLSYALAKRDDFEVLVALEHPERVQDQALTELWPFPGRLLDRNRWGARREIARFAPDLLLVDNAVPSYRIAQHLCVLWHGFGWRVDDVSAMRRELHAHVGDVTQPATRFVWQAFGEFDREYCVRQRKIHDQNVRVLGAAYSDDLQLSSEFRESFEAQRVAHRYRVDIVGRRTVLLAPTWHHAGMFGHWGPEAELLERLIVHLERLGANLLVRMHDRRRYPKRYARQLEHALGRHAHTQVKFRDEAPDSLVDLLVSDVMVTNYSSIANAYYYTGKPTVHIDPVRKGEPAMYRRLRRRGVVEERIERPEGLWKLPPEEHGGLRATSFAELIEQLERGLREPQCCQQAARAFLDRYIVGVDGTTCDRIAGALRELVEQ